MKPPFLPNHLQVVIDSSFPDAPEGLVPDALVPVLGGEYAQWNKQPARVGVLFTDDPTIAQYHADYLNQEGPADVLSFPDGEVDPDDQRVYLGDIVVSVDTARQVAAERGLDPQQEIVLYALHGLLHLLGMDDDTPANQAAMEARQEAAFVRQGWTYDRDSPQD